MDRFNLRLARGLAHTLVDALSAQIALTQSNVDPGRNALAYADEDAETALADIAKLMGFELVAKRPVLVAAE